MHRYKHIVLWSREDQRWIISVLELSGCMADGAIPVEALENVETIIDEWIETVRAMGCEIPKPKGRLLYA